MHLASTFLPVTQVDTGDSLLEAGTTDRGRHEADRGRHEAELWMKTYGEGRLCVLPAQQSEGGQSSLLFGQVERTLPDPGAGKA
ncbi:hypothetical protein T4C_8190 [Trichinella pseudospiralis]|uniref:Uncharacterized protein n=1 Tax=Trichinella pseudospiralis TaxID=6337 RepID=A0A0V1J186_TRIPS|nr:hypothetical protein T4C_8190 [Trichinella pseudospiralis]